MVSFRASIQLLVRNMRGGLVFKDHRLVCHSTLGLRVIKKKKLSNLSLSCRMAGPEVFEEAPSSYIEEEEKKEEQEVKDKVSNSLRVVHRPK